MINHAGVRHPIIQMENLCAINEHGHICDTAASKFTSTPQGVFQLRHSPPSGWSPHDCSGPRVHK